MGASTPPGRSHPHSALFPLPPLPTKCSQLLPILYAMGEASQAGRQERVSYTDPPQTANAPLVATGAWGQSRSAPAPWPRAGDCRVCPLSPIKEPPTWGAWHFQTLSFCLICFKAQTSFHLFLKCCGERWALKRLTAALGSQRLAGLAGSGMSRGLAERT